MRCRLQLGMFLGAIYLFPTFLPAQAGLPTHNEIRESALYFHDVQHSKQVAGKVSDINGVGLVHAQIEIMNNAGAGVQLLRSDEDGLFQTQYNFNEITEEVKHFAVTLKVTKKGYRVAHLRWEISDQKIEGIPITLRPIQAENPALLPQAEMIKLVTPRLRQLTPADGLDPKDEKDYGRGVQDFLEHNHFEQAVQRFAKVSKNNPNCLRCRTMLALAELSWGDWDGAKRDVGTSVNAYLADKKLGSFEPLFVQGELSGAQGDPERAVGYLAEAVKFAPQDPLGLGELGRAQCLDLDWFGAAETLKKAVAAGAGPDAQLMLAEALSWSATPQEAEAAFNVYVNGREIKNLPPRAQSVWANLQSRRKENAAVAVAVTKAKNRGVEPVDYIDHPPIKSLEGFEPAADQSLLASLLEGVGKNVGELFANLPNLCSTENVHQERLTRKGSTASEQEFQYRYLLTAQEKEGGPIVDEVRANFRGHEMVQLGGSEGYMLTSGFVSAPLVFHPAYQAGSRFRLLGVQTLNGRRTLVIAYAQEPGKTRIWGSFQVGKTASLTYTQGMAWVDAENYEIVRLVTDLLRPAPLVKLDKENTEINFSEVQFKKQTRKFWLPNAVMVTLEWNGRVLRNKHSYSEFLVSNVDSFQKIALPKTGAKTADNSAPPARLPTDKPSPSPVSQ